MRTLRFDSWCEVCESEAEIRVTVEDTDVPAYRVGPQPQERRVVGGECERGHGLDYNVVLGLVEDYERRIRRLAIDTKPPEA